MTRSLLRRPIQTLTGLAVAGLFAGATLGSQGCAAEVAPEEQAAQISAAQVTKARLWVLNRNGNPSLADFWSCLLGDTGWNQLAGQYANPEEMSFGKEAWVSGGACNPGGPTDQGAFQCAVDAGGFDVGPYDIVLIIRDDAHAGGQNNSAGAISVKNPATHKDVPINSAEIGTGRIYNTWDYLFVYASHEVFEAQTDGVSGDCCDGETAWGGQFNWCAECGGPSGGCGQHQGDLGITHLTCPSGHTYAYQKMSPPGSHEFDGTCVSFPLTKNPPPPPKPPPPQAPSGPCAKISGGNDGTYCGSSSQSGFGGGSPTELYDCQNGHVAKTAACPFGCFVAPAGQADGCHQDPCTGVPASGDGAYCGASKQDGFKGGNPRVVYECQGGHTHGTTTCGGACFVAPAGQADHC